MIWSAGKWASFCEIAHDGSCRSSQTRKLPDHLGLSAGHLADISLIIAYPPKSFLKALTRRSVTLLCQDSQFPVNYWWCPLTGRSCHTLFGRGPLTNVVQLIWYFTGILLGFWSWCKLWSRRLATLLQANSMHTVQFLMMTSSNWCRHTRKLLAQWHFFAGHLANISEHSYKPSLEHPISILKVC